MPSFIAYFVAGFCGAGFVAIWFRSAYKELSAARNSLLDLERQIHLHERFFFLVREGPDAGAAASMLETSRMLYREAAKEYNRIISKPMNILPAFLMGFRPAKTDHKS